MFDPYHKWLGIPKDQRPPTYYQLLGIAPGETDVEVIDEAAVRQTTHVRAYQIGPHAAQCTKLLNEIAQAKTTLLSPSKRGAYDEQLARAKASQITAQLPMATAIVTAPDTSAFTFDEPGEPIAAPPRRNLDIAKPVTNRSALIWIIAGAGGGVIVLLLALVTWMMSSRPGPQFKQGFGAADKVAEVKPVPKAPEVPKVENDAPRPIEVKRPKQQNPPVVVEPAPVKPPPGEMAVAGARSFKIVETRVDWLSLSPDGSKVALGFLNPHVYEVATGQRLTMFPPRKVGGIVRTPVAFFPDNLRVLFAYGSDPGAAVGDSATGQALFHLEQEGVQFATCLAVDKDGKRALIAYNYRLVYWDLETQKVIERWQTKGIIDEVIFTSDGRGAVTGDKSGVVVTWDLDQLTPGPQFKAPPNLHALAVSPDGSTIAAGSKGGIALLDVKSRKVQTINSPSFSGAVTFCAGGKQLLAGDRDGEIRVFDVSPIKHTGTLRAHKQEVTRIAVDAKENTLVSADNGGRVVVWPLAAALLAKAPPAAAPAVLVGAAVPPPGLQQIVQGRIQGAYRLAFLPDGKSFMSGGLNLEHWDMTGNLRRQFAKKMSVGDQLSMSLSADGQRVVWGHGKDAPTVFDVATGQPIGALERQMPLRATALTPDGNFLLAGFEKEKNVLLWDITKGEIVRELPLDYLQRITFAPDGKHLLWTFSGGIQWVDVATWQVAAHWRIGVFGMPAFTRDSRTMAFGTGNQGVQLYDMQALQPIGQMPCASAQQLAFCAGGQLLLIAKQGDRAITVWDVAQRTQVAAWEVPQQLQVFCVDPQEGTLLAITLQGNAYTWPLPRNRAELN